MFNKWLATGLLLAVIFSSPSARAIPAPPFASVVPTVSSACHCFKAQRQRTEMMEAELSAREREFEQKFTVLTTRRRNFSTDQKLKLDGTYAWIDEFKKRLTPISRRARMLEAVACGDAASPAAWHEWSKLFTRAGKILGRPATVGERIRIVQSRFDRLYTRRASSVESRVSAHLQFERGIMENWRFIGGPNGHQQVREVLWWSEIPRPRLTGLGESCSQELRALYDGRGQNRLISAYARYPARQR